MSEAAGVPQTADRSAGGLSCCPLVPPVPGGQRRRGAEARWGFARLLWGALQHPARLGAGVSAVWRGAAEELLLSAERQCRVSVAPRCTGVPREGQGHGAALGQYQEQKGQKGLGRSSPLCVAGPVCCSLRQGCDCLWRRFGVAHSGRAHGAASASCVGACAERGEKGTVTQSA